MLFYHGNGETAPTKEISNERLAASTVSGMATGASVGTSLFFTKTMGAWGAASLGLVGCLFCCTVMTCMLSTDRVRDMSINSEDSPLMVGSSIEGSPYEEVPITPPQPVDAPASPTLRK